MLSHSAIRYASAGVAGAVAIVYYLIAAGVISVVSTAPQSGDWIIPAAAGTAFLVLAVVLVATENRLAAVAGVALSVLTIVGYFVVAPHRTPSYELWGILIKIAQGVLVLSLGYLAIARPEQQAIRRQLT